MTKIDQTDWTAAYLSEIDRIAALTPDRMVDTVFFGGGTPSLMNVETVAAILDRIQRRWRLRNDVEITLEANPTSIEADRFTGYRGAGVNRVSVGVQALNDTDLKRLGRLHSAEEALAAVDIARNTFERVSFDLIYARQDQSVTAWTRELQQALDLNPDHLSLYQLTIEEGTAFGDRFKRGSLRGLPDEDLGADLWDVTQELCENAGLPGYETSNHARVGQESRHNLIYWKSGDWAGIGPGAHGRLTLEGIRYETAAPRPPGAWRTAVQEGTGDQIFKALDQQSVLEERLMMGLRLRDGIAMPRDWISLKTNKIKELDEISLLTLSGETLRTTQAGRPVLNSILNVLLAD